MSVIINASTTSGLVMSSDLSGNLQFQNNGVNLPMGGVAPAFSAYQLASSTITNNTASKILFNTEIFDTNNNFASSRFTPTVAGYYQINATVTWNSGIGTNIIYIFKNGAEIARGSRVAIAVPDFVGLPVSSLIYLNGSTDYVEIYAFTTGGTVSTETGFSTIFSGSLVRGA